MTDDPAAPLDAEPATPPPKSPPRRPAAPSTVAEQLRRAIAESGRSIRSLSDEAGLHHAVVSRFATAETDLLLGSASRLCRVLGLRLVESGRAPAKRRP